MRRVLAAMVMFTAGAMAASADSRSSDAVAERLEKKMVEVRQEFSDVEHVSTSALSETLEDTLVIDVRKADEFAVSRIPGAIHAPNTERLLEIAGTSGDRPIVVYCSLGVRSSIAVRELESAGYGSVSNLDGSLFLWANEGRPLVNDAGETDKVHPFNAWWGRYLEGFLHAYKPD
ncbi:MAG: rhodanese-like domain-containing protein [Pseudomonadota bacterium]